LVEITWFGHGCFRLRDRTVSVITDPYSAESGLQLTRMRADIVTVSENTSDHNYVRGVKSGYKLLTGPGEYEIAGIFVTGLELAGSKKQPVPKPRNTVFVFEFEDITVCHLGNLDHVPSPAQVEEALSMMDVLLVPVGGGQALNAAQASEVVSLLEPRVVIPMCYQVKGSTLTLDPVDKFLKEIGLEQVTSQESLKVSRGMLPDESRVVLLEIYGQAE
jgi:L-ascorbate metabolism protein UlaG (beta-lactamase superfamily)